ncbi:MAG: pentapeptide repeat-containing protein [Candidatus Sericytochromatia bacterium]|nr:pentapeptide repeat-containing protein [Candidatus Sericytochromatia bacterium]
MSTEDSSLSPSVRLGVGHLLREDQRLKDQLFRSPVSAQRLLSLVPGQMRTSLKAMLRSQRDRSRFAKQQLSRSDAGRHGEVISFFNGVRRGESWRPTVLHSVDLRDRNLCQVDFRGCVLLDVDLSGTDLRGASFAGAILWRVGFRGALMDDETLAFLLGSENRTLHGLDEVEYLEGSDFASPDGKDSRN